MQIYTFDPAPLVAAYSTVGSQVVEMVESVPAESWWVEALGPWDLRALVAHTMRSFTGVTNYLAEGEGREIDLEGPISYYTAVFAASVSTSDIDRRAMEAGEALQGNVAAHCRSDYEAAMAAIGQRSLNAAAKTPFGVMSLADYLPSRIVELVAHGEDLKVATGSAVEFDSSAIEITSVICSSVASRRGLGVEAVLALAGRWTLKAGFNVLGFE